MMNFEDMKADLLETYKADLCDESIEAINNAKDLPEFIRLLAKFSAFLNYKEIPKIDWVNKWFNTPELMKVANDNGVYYKGFATIVNPTLHIVLMGDVKAVVTCAQPHMYQITAQDDSNVEIATFCNCFVKLRMKGNSKHKVITKNQYSRIVVNKI